MEKQKRGRKPRGTPTEFRLKIPDEDGELIRVGDVLFSYDTGESGRVTSSTKINLDDGEYKQLEDGIYVRDEHDIKNHEQKTAQFKRKFLRGPIPTGLVDLCGRKIYAGDAVFLPIEKQVGWVNRYGILVDTKGLNMPLKDKQFISIEDILSEILLALLVTRGVIV